MLGIGFLPENTWQHGKCKFRSFLESIISYHRGNIPQSLSQNVDTRRREQRTRIHGKPPLRMPGDANAANINSLKSEGGSNALYFAVQSAPRPEMRKARGRVSNVDPSAGVPGVDGAAEGGCPAEEGGEQTVHLGGLFWTELEEIEGGPLNGRD